MQLQPPQLPTNSSVITRSKSGGTCDDVQISSWIRGTKQSSKSEHLVGCWLQRDETLAIYDLSSPQRSAHNLTPAQILRNSVCPAISTVEYRGVRLFIYSCLYSTLLGPLLLVLVPCYLRDHYRSLPMSLTLSLSLLLANRYC